MDRELVAIFLRPKRDQIRLMTNSHKSQSEKPATGGGRENYSNEAG